MGIANRKIYFIKKDFQFRFILRFVITTTVWAAATVSLFTIMAGKRLEEFLYSPHINIKTTAELLMPSAVHAHIISLLFFTALLIYAIRSLWKKLGVPLYSLKKDITRMTSGDLVSGVALRGDEEFQDLASDLDRMRGELRDRFVRLKEREDELSAAVSTLDRAVLKGSPSADHISAVREATAKMRQELKGFTY
jgi:methyl-accepting chemotaxis protein